MTFKRSNFCVRENSSGYWVNNDSCIHNSHDSIYRYLFNNDKEVALFFKYFINYDLSYDDIHKYNRSYVTSDLKSKYADIVYNYKNLPIYILIEHQSYIDNSMPYRIFEYYSEILRDTIDKDKLKNKNYKFPVVIPIVFYTGNKPWKLVSNVNGKQFVADFNFGEIDIKFNFIDINNYSIDDLIKIDSCIAFIMAIDKCKDIDTFSYVINSLANVKFPYFRKENLEHIISYIANSKFDKNIATLLLNKFNEGNDVSMKCVWDYLKEDEERIKLKFLNEGKREGKLEGKREGKLEYKSKFVKNMLKNGETVEKIRLYTGATIKEIEKIRDELAVC